MQSFLNLAFMLALAASLPAAAEAGGAEADTVVVGLAPGCRDRDMIAAAVSAVAGAGVLEGRVMTTAARAGAGPVVSLKGFESGVAGARRLYYALSFADAIRELERIALELPTANVKLEDDARRWELFDSASAYIALSRLGAGDREGYDAAISDLAGVRPEASFGAAFPPGFRKSFKKARAAAARADSRMLSVTTTSGGWEIRIDGRAQGKAPFEIAVPKGPHYVGVVSPEGSIFHQKVDVTSDPHAYRADPFSMFASTAGRGTVVCLPDGELPADPGYQVVAGMYGARELVVVTASGGGVLLSYWRGGTDPVKRSQLLDASGISDSGRINEAARAIVSGPVPAAPAADVMQVGTKVPFVPEPRLQDLAVPATPAVQPVQAHGGGSEKWYKQWWFWTAAGVVVAAAVGIPLGLALDGGNGVSGSLGAVKLNQ
ncbi:MAG: PEGA domain-containing protein [Myxococcota bacterium]|jgi:hypothetical protein